MVPLSSSSSSSLSVVCRVCVFCGLLFILLVEEGGTGRRVRSEEAVKIIRDVVMMLLQLNSVCASRGNNK